ncbi:DUF4349 domain-containing protein [Spirillospora sp. NPDC047279]|uniref:DUF4349 domain-containing protein n=1 Tax=Spirillospora sp. NPDC047279 TaxID=3155478 RepID=UPI0033F10AA6
MLCALIALLVAGVLLAGCAADGDQASTESADRSASGGNPGVPKAVAPSSASRGDTGGSGGTGGGSTGTAQVKLDPAGAGRSVIYQSDLRVRAKNVDTATTRAKQLVTAAGGYVDNESSTTEPVGANLTFKIPAERYPAVLEQLAGQLGTKLSLRQQAEDVTGEVADVDSRVRSAEATLGSFRKLLDKARTVGEVMNVEQEISQRQADLEALQARQKSLQQRTRFATVTLTLEAPKGSSSPAGKSREGFLGGLESGWDALTTFTKGLLLVLGWLLPFLVPLSVIAAVFLAVRRRWTARRPYSPASTPPSGAPPAAPSAGPQPATVSAGASTGGPAGGAAGGPAGGAGGPAGGAGGSTSGPAGGSSGNE